MKILGPLYASLIVDAVGGFSTNPYAGNACCFLSFALVATALFLAFGEEK